MNGQHTGNAQNTGWRPPRRFSVTVQRLARPPMPWTWAIHEDDAAEPCHRSSRFYRSAEEAWAVGRAMLPRLTDPIHRTRTTGNRSEASESRPIPD
jgi:hypothetical protein